MTSSILSETSPRTVLFLGDCNTLGTPDIEGNAYPEIVAKALALTSINCGHTMCTVREGSEYFKRYYTSSIDAICLQFGVVDSWQTFRYSPYVLYYPDSAWRKLGRKLTKKFKKWCKALGLNRLIGTRNVVPIEEYIERMIQIVQSAAPKPVILIETIPNKDTQRNPDIRRYNAAMHTIARHHEHCSVLETYAEFESTRATSYSDATHINQDGHAFIAQQLIEQLSSTSKAPLS